MNFNIEKNRIMFKLEEYSYKLKFTEKYIKTFKKIPDSDRFIRYCTSYNNLIDECNFLKNKLEKIKKWGFIFNSKIYWINKLSLISLAFKFYSDNMLDIIIYNTRCKTCRILDEDCLNIELNMYEKLKVYLKISKINGEYIYIGNDANILLNKEYFI